MSQVTISVRGPVFSKKIDAVVERAIVEEALEKIAERIARPGRTLGRRVNKIDNRINGTELVSTTTLRTSRKQAFRTFGRGAVRNPDFNPRSVGSAWVKNHVGAMGFGKGIIGAMAPNVIRKISQRVVAELD